MKKLILLATSCLVVFCTDCAAQDQLQSHIRQMKTSYAASGSVVVQDNQTLLIQPNMPAPICAVPKNESGKTTWSFYAFPLASISVPLASIDETLISEDIVFTGPDAQSAYKPGDLGDTTMIVVVGVPGKSFHALMYDREKLATLGPGPHDASSYGQRPDDVEAFGLTFADRAAADAFVAALKHAVILAKTQAIAKAEPARR